MIQVQSLTELNTEEVQQALVLLTQMVQEDNPTLDVKSGAFRDTVLAYSAPLATANQTNIDIVRQSSSLYALAQNPELVDDDVLDRLASNYRLTRNQGSYAQGNITVVVSSSLPLLIASGAVFQASNGQKYVTTSSYTGRSDESQIINDTDILMLEQADENWSMTFPAQSQEQSSSGNLSRLSQITPESTLPNFVTAYAGTDFVGGTSTELNSSLISRMQSGIAHKSLASRTSIEGVIRDDPRFTFIPGVSVIGYGDPEQRRYHSVFPIAHGGRVDAYVRTLSMVSSKVLTKNAVFIEEEPGEGGVWQFTLDRDDAPGFYEVTNILQTDQAATEEGYEVQQDVRGFDLTPAPSEESTPGTSFFPDIELAEEATFSRYQTAVVRFIDTDTSVSGLTPGVSNQDYIIHVSLLPDLDLVQDLLSTRSVRSPVGDCLVKAPVPCFVEVTMTITQNQGDVDLDLDSIRQAIADAGNAVGFTGRLSASLLIMAAITQIHTQGATSTTVGSVSLEGRILRPDSTETTLSSSHTLIVPDEPELMVTARTVAFFLDQEDITLTIITVALP